MPKVQGNESFQGKRDKAGSKSPISCVVTPGNSYKFSITMWTETGIGEYGVEVSRVKGGEGGSKREKVAVTIKRQFGELVVGGSSFANNELLFA